MQNCVGEVLLLGIFAVTAYRDWKEQMICVYVPLAAGIAGLVLHLMLPTQKLTDLLLGAGIGAVLLLAAWVSREEIGYGDGAMLMASGIFLGFWRNVELFLTALMLIVPAALFAFAMKSGIQMYTECRDTALAIGQEQEIEAVKMFYRWQEAGELFQNEDTVY